MYKPNKILVLLSASQINSVNLSEESYSIEESKLITKKNKQKKEYKLHAPPVIKKKSRPSKEEKEEKESLTEYKIYLWCKALIIFSYLSLFFAVVFTCLHAYFLYNLKAYTNFNIQSLPFFFEY